MNTLKEIVEVITGMDNIMIVSHASPDGDTLGSAVSLLRVLKSMGKKVKFACGDVIPRGFNFLFEGIENEDFEEENIITVDIASPQLLGTLSDIKVDLVIDHHTSSSIDAKYRYVDATAAANVLNMYDIYKEMNVEITKEIADALFLGLTTDTGCFKFSNAGARVHIAAAELINLGADHTFINKLMFDSKSKAALRVEQNVYSNMKFFYDDKIVVAYIPMDLIEKTGADENDMDAIPSLVRGIEGVSISITLKQRATGMWKVSVRAVAPYNAAKICQKFDGGGHAGAAGCTFSNDLNETETKLISAVIEHMESLS